MWRWRSQRKRRRNPRAGGEPAEPLDSTGRCGRSRKRVESALPDIRRDPLRWVAEAAGYGDGERWWEHLVEQRQDSRKLFQAILELMTALRAQGRQPVAAGRAGAAGREGAMRTQLRAAQKEGHERIAVVCGTWHAPALANPPPGGGQRPTQGAAHADFAATWTPWTHGQLSSIPTYSTLLRGKPPPAGWRGSPRGCATTISPPQPPSVIEAARLAGDWPPCGPRPRLEELNEAALAVLCHGDATPLRREEPLLIGERLGEVPDHTPTLPLQQDLQRQQKRLRLPPKPPRKGTGFRKPNDLEDAINRSA